MTDRDDTQIHADTLRAWNLDTRPTPAELPDELDKPHKPPTVHVRGWDYPARLCRAPGCDRLVARHLGRMCDDCQDLYNDQR